MKKFLLFLGISLSVIVSSDAATNVVFQEGFEGGTLPEGWTQEYVSEPVTLGYDTINYSWLVEQADSGLMYPTGAHGGTARAFARNSSGNEMRFVTRLVTPVMNLRGVFRPQIIFSHAEMAKSGMGDTLRVYYKTGPNDYWHQFSDAVYARESVWKTDTLSVVSPSAAYQFAFEITENLGRGVVLDDIIVQATPTCQDVERIVASQVHAYDATVTWTAVGAYNYFQLLVSPEPITDFDNLSDDVVLYDELYNAGTLLENLVPETYYYVYVRSDCDESTSGFTDWIAGSFRTLKVAYLPYTEDFNNSILFDGNSNLGMPDGWSYGNDYDNLALAPHVLRNGSSTVNLHYSIDTTAYLAFGDVESLLPVAVPVGQYVYAATPEIVAESLNGLEVSFYATAYNMVSVGTDRYESSLIVGVMTDPANYASFTPIDTIHLESAYLFKRFTVSLDGYTGSAKYVALATDFGKRNMVAIDNFSMKMPQVHVPNHVKISDVCASGFTISADLYDASSWEVMVADAYSRSGNVSAGNVLLSQSGLTGGSFKVSDASLAGRIVTVYLRATKNGEVSEWSFPVTLRVPTEMPLLTDENTFTIGFEGSTNTLNLSLLNNELRDAPSLIGTSLVFYPVTSLDAERNSFPKLSNSAPNYNGTHVVLSGVDSWFVLPESQNALSELKLVFRYASPVATQPARVAVGVMTDPYDFSTFEQVALFSTSEITYRRGLVSFDEYQGTGKYIAFRSVDAGVASVGSSILLDEIVVSKLGDCREPSNVQVSAHSSYANITWNGGGMQGWIVGCSKSAALADYERRDTVYTPSYTFAGLDMMSTYYFTVEAICNGEGIGLDGVIYDFTTPRGLPFDVTFSSSIPQGWTRSSSTASSVFNGGALTSSTSGWSFTNSPSYVFEPQSGYVAYVDVYSTSCHYWLISPALNVDVPEGESMELTFDLGVHGYQGSTIAGEDDKFMVIVSEDGGNTWRQENATVWSNDGQGDYVLNNLYWEGAMSVAIDFSKYIGKTLKFAFYAESTRSNEDNYISIDNVSLRVRDEACGGVSNVTALGISSTEGRVNWQLGGINPHPAIVEMYSTANYAESSLIRRDTVQGTNILYTDLSPMTRYYIRVKQMCDNDVAWKTVLFHTTCETMTPDEFGIETFDDVATIDCWHTGFAYNNGEGELPDRVAVENYGGVLRIAKTLISEAASDGAYAISPELLVGDSINKYQVIFDACTYSQSSTNVGRIVVGVVTDPADAGNTFERMAELKLEYSADSTHMATYVIPLVDYIGDLDGNFGHYFMFLSEAGADSTNYVYIDNIQFELAQGCHQVVDLQATNITTQSVDLHWSGNADKYEVAVSQQLVKSAQIEDGMFDSRAVIDAVDAPDGMNTYVMGGLQATSTYYAYVRAICGNDTSRWSAGREFKTKVGVPFYENFSSTSLTDGTWTGYSGLFTGNVIQTSDLSTSSSWSLTTSDAYLSDAQYQIKGMAGYKVRQNLYGTSCHYWLVSPELDLTDVDGAEIILSAKIAITPYYSSQSQWAGSDDRFGLLISVDGGVTWKKEDAFFFALDDLRTTARRVSADVSAYGGKQIRFAIYDESTVSNGDNYIYVDSIALVAGSTECAGVRYLTATNTGLNDVKVDWRVIGTPDSVKVELSQDAAFASLSDSLLTDTNVCVFTGLDYNATYYVRVSQVGCDTSVVISFRSANSIPYVEPFSTSARPESWTALSGALSAAFNDSLPTPASSTRTWIMSSASNGLTGTHLLGEVYMDRTLNQQWLVSPDVVLAASDDENVGLVFDLALTNHGSAAAATNLSDQSFWVLLSTDGGESWSESDAWRFAEDDEAYMRLSEISATGGRIQIDLSGYRNNRVRIAFYKETSSIAVDNDIHIANVQLRVIGDECDEPENLRVSDVGLYSAVLTWDGRDDKPAVVEYSRNADLTSATSVLVAEGSTYTLSGLTPGTTYYVRVKQICNERSESGYSNVVTLTTLYGLPYHEPFATLSSWTRMTGVLDSIFAGQPLARGTGGWTATNRYNQILGEEHIYCSRSNTNVWWLVSPQIDLSSASADYLSLSFDMAVTQRYSGDNVPTSYDNATEFDVVVSLDGGQTWSDSLCWRWGVNNPNAAFDLTAVPNGAGDNYVIDFSRFAGKKITIGFVFGGKSGNICVNINNLNLESITSRCFGVTGLTVGTVDTSAIVTIMPNDEASQWELAYGVTGTELQDMGSVISESLTCSLGGLELTSSYDVYVRSICGAGDSSVWGGPFRFTTPLGIPYTDALSSLGDWSRYTGVPDSVFAGGSLVSTGSGWSATTYTSNLGVPHMICSKNSTVTYWLVSPEINLMPQTGDKSIYLSFNLALSGSANSTTSPAATKGHSFRVAVSDDGGATWAEESSFLWSDEEDVSADYSYSGIPAGMGMSYHLDLSKHAGKKIRIAFIEGAASTGIAVVHLAGVEIAEFDQLCFGVDAVSVRPGGNKATVELSSTEVAGTTWEYAIGAQGFVPSAANSVATGITSFVINGLSGQTTYDLYVRSICSEEDRSVWKGPYRFTTLEAAYLLPFSNNLNWGSTFNSEWKRYSVTESLGELSLTSSGSGWLTTTSTNGFATPHVKINTWSSNRYMFTTPYISLEDANSAELSFDLALTEYNQSSSPSSESGHSFYVLISEEEGVGSTDGNWSINKGWRWSDAGTADYSYIEIPATGETYTLDLSDYLGSIIRIGFYAVSTGGTGDLDLHIRNVKVDTLQYSGSGCSYVRGMKVNSYSYTDANVTFRGQNIDNILQLEYKVVPEYSLFSSVPSQFADTNVVTITGLWPSSNYQIYARVQCATDSTWSEWNLTKPFVLRTSECSVITGVNALETTFNGAIVSLVTDAPSAAVGYQAVLVDKGGMPDPADAVSSATNRLSLEKALSPSTEYDVYARKICVEGDTSEWYGPFSIMSPIGVPYADAMDWTTFSSQWSRYSGSLTSLSSSTSGWSSGTSRAGKGFDENHVYVNTWSTYTYMLVSPQISLEGDFSSLTLSFDVALTAYNSASVPSNYTNQEFYVLVSTDNNWSVNNGWSWRNGGTYEYSDISESGTTYDLDLSEYIGQSVRIGFYVVSRSGAGDNDIHLRNVSISEGGSSTTCAGIKDVQQTKATLNSVTFTFAYRDETLDDLNKTAEYEISDRQDFLTVLSSGTIKSVQTYTITGLSASSRYYVRMRQICDGGEVSAWTRGEELMTLLGIRYIEDFNSSISGWAFDTTMYAGNGAVINHPSYKESSNSYGVWKYNRATADDNVFPTPYMRMNVYSNNHHWMISPEIDLTSNAGQGLLFAFDIALYGYKASPPYSMASMGSDDKFIVAISVDDGVTWLPSNSYVWDNTGNGDYVLNNYGLTPQRVLLDFSKFAGKRIKIGFYAESTESNGDNWLAIDNLDLNKVELISLTDSVCQYSDYANYGFEFEESQLSLGDNSFTYLSAGFDTLQKLDLYVMPISTDTVSGTLCEGELFSAYGFNLRPTESGLYRHVEERVNGCDSITYANLTVIPKSRVDVTQDVCAGTSVTINGKTYYNNAIALDTLSSQVTGCDSIVTYYLTFSDMARLNSEITRVVCAGEIYSDGLFRTNQAGVYTKTTTSITGCDSTVTLTLYAADALGYVYDTVAAENLPYVFNGETLIERNAEIGDYTFDIDSLSTCGSAELHVYVRGETALDNVRGETMYVTPNPAKVGQQIMLMTDLSSMSDVRLSVYDAVGHLVYTTTDRTGIIPGMPAAGYYTIRLNHSKGEQHAKLLVK